MQQTEDTSVTRDEQHFDKISQLNLCLTSFHSQNSELYI